MYSWLNKKLLSLRECFSREASFRWFVILVIGFMLRQDHLGVTSIIRCLDLNPCFYETMLHFFRSNAWKIDRLTKEWIRLVARTGLLFTENLMPILIGDGVKAAKEARYMPCVKRHYQESETVSKAAYIFGHMFGAIGILVGNSKKLFCVPLSIRIHDGDKQIKKWGGNDTGCESHVVRTIRDACSAVKVLGMKSILLLDRYYLSVPALMAIIDEETRAGKSLLSVVMRAKRNPTAYLDPIPNKRGRPRIKGEKVKISNLFETCLSEFTEAAVTLYGKDETVKYYCCDLLWGKKLYQKLRFVLVLKGDSKSIFVSTDLSLTPEQILKLYGYRFKIECSFREFKQVVAGFSYRFWSLFMPKLNRFAKSGHDCLESVTDEHAQKRILLAFKAIEGFVMVASIAFGLLQMCALQFAEEITAPKFRWVRTRSNEIPSEATTSHFMGKTIFRTIAQRHDLAIMRFIFLRQSHAFEISAVADLHDAS